MPPPMLLARSSSAQFQLSWKSPISAEPLGEVQDSFLYLIYHYNGDNGPRFYSFHKVDLDLLLNDVVSDVKPFPPPLFILYGKSFPNYMGFLQLERKILMFGGFFILPDCSYNISYDVLVYDTRKKEPSDGQDLVDFFDKLPPMTGPKSLPIVFTVEKKIYVLSSTISYDFHSPSFEEFDLENQSWSSLPDLPKPEKDCHYPRRSSRRYEIESYAVHGSKLIVSIPRFRLFTLDVTTKATPWTEVSILGGVDRLPFRYGAEHIDGLWYAMDRIETQLYAYDFSTHDGLTKAWCTPPTKFDSELLGISPRCLVFRLGSQTVGVVACGQPNEFDTSHITLQLAVYLKKAKTDFLFPIHHHVVTFEKKDIIDDVGCAVRGCFLMKK